MSGLPLHAIAGKPETALFLLKQVPGRPMELVLLPNLRHSGLLHILPLELLQVLAALLTFQERGEVRASVSQVAQVLHLHPDQAESRLEQLASYNFDGAVLVFEYSEGIYSLSKRVGVPVPVERMPDAPSEPPVALARREEVIEHSRKIYGTPRPEAEMMVAEQLGLDKQEPIPEGREGEIFRAMLNLGVPEVEVRALLRDFDVEEVEHQLLWLPERGARHPARFLSAAIRGSYESPEVKQGRQQ